MLSLVLAATLLGVSPPVQTPGHLVIVGGGLLPPTIVQKTLAVAGGKDAHVLVIPQASIWKVVGDRGARMWRAAGARDVSVLDLQDPDAALRAVSRADLIWISGGSQARLMRILEEYHLIDAIRERYRQGATIAGSSAGAAVMSQIMLLGRGMRRPVLDFVETTGLGLWPDVIVDQHYLIRHRYPRLLKAVLHHPDKPGIGIDEHTAVVVEGRHFEVIGVSKVMVLDARALLRAKASEGAPPQTRVATYLLGPGMSFDLDRGLMSAQPTGLSSRPPSGGRVAQANPVH